MSHSSNLDIQFRKQNQIVNPQTEISKDGTTLCENLDTVFYKKRKILGKLEISFQSDKMFIYDYYESIDLITNFIKDFCDENDLTFKMVLYGEENGDIYLIKYEEGNVETTSIQSIIKKFLK